MAQIFDAPSKAILRSQIAEHIAETDKNDKRELQAGEEPLPNDRFFDRELSWLKFKVSGEKQTKEFEISSIFSSFG